MLLAAEQLGRWARVMELDPKFADVSIRRWQKYTRRDAVHLGTGITFASRAALTPRAAAHAACPMRVRHGRSWITASPNCSGATPSPAFS
jgi:hypothetical protein